MKNTSRYLLIFMLTILLLPFVAPAQVPPPDTVQPDTLAAVANAAATGAANQVVSITGSNFSMHSLLRGILGMAVLLAIAYLFSVNRRAIAWRVVFIGLGIQLALALGILFIPAVRFVFETGGRIFVEILNFTRVGSEFLLGNLLNVETYGFIFAFQVLPTILFFSALMSLLFYGGIIQVIVKGLAWMLSKALRVSGAESLCAAGNIFLGQTEAPLMIKPYLPNMTRSEIFLVMTAGMATMAGGVLAAYISFLGGTDPVQRLIFAKHLLAASVMAAPGAIVISKMLVPQTEIVDKTIVVPKDKIGSNVLDAISNGTGEGLKLLANVAAMLLVFVAFIAMANYILSNLIGHYTGLNNWVTDISNGRYTGLTLQFILGYVFAPLMWLIGVCSEDITLVGSLLGQKIIMTEFIGYISLAEYKTANLFTEYKSVVMATYLLCGFANFASIGIQIGGIGALAPNQKVQLSAFGMRSLLGGTLAGLMSATIIGMITG